MLAKKSDFSSNFETKNWIHLKIPQTNLFTGDQERSKSGNLGCMSKEISLWGQKKGENDYLFAVPERMWGIRL